MSSSEPKRRVPLNAMCSRKLRQPQLVRSLGERADVDVQTEVTALLGLVVDGPGVAQAVVEVPEADARIGGQVGRFVLPLARGMDPLCLVGGSRRDEGAQEDEAAEEGKSTCRCGHPANLAGRGVQSVENRWMVVCRYVSPSRSTTDGNDGWLIESG